MTDQHVSTGIAGLDEVLYGGLMAQSSYLLVGHAGTGKTILSLQWLLDGSEIPAVALTAYSRLEDRMKALQAGFQMHVGKPAEPVELLTVIASLVQRAGKPPSGQANGQD